jgi:phage terminase large subunit-like protein
VLEQQVGKFRPSKTAEILLEMVNRWKLKQVYIEQVGGFKAIGYTVQEHFKSKQAWVRVNEYKPGQAKKKTRIENYLEPLFKGASVHLPYYLKTNSIVQDEIQFFPNETVTDDVLDSWSMLVEIARPPMTQEQKKVNQGRPPRAFRNTRYGGTR